MNLAQLRAALDQHGVSLTLTAEGKIRPRADQPPPPELVDAMREHKTALLEGLQNEVKRGNAEQPDGAIGCSAEQQDDVERHSAAPQNDQSRPTFEPSDDSKRLTFERENGMKRYTADPLELGKERGRCGSCARWAAHPAPADHMGVCSAGRAAHGWLDGAALTPVETQAALLCQVYGGSGWRKMLKNDEVAAQPA